MTYLGDACRLLGEFGKSRQVLEDALRIREAVWGLHHPDVAHTLSSLAALHANTGDHQRRKELLERVLAIQEEAYGVNHQSVGLTLHKLAIAQGSLGDTRGEAV